MTSVRPMDPLDVSITIRIQVRPLVEIPARPIERPPERPNGGEPRKRGRPSLKPKILELVRDLARFHGPGWT